MPRFVACVAGLSILLLGLTVSSEGRGEQEVSRYTLVIHGGAGTITRAQMTPDREAAYTAALGEALQAGQQILAAGGTSLDAVVAAIRVMEDQPLFNAGRGSVFTAEGAVELDASIMDGATRQAGAVAGVTRIKNPILAARAVMDRSRHVMLQGGGADVFAEAQGLELVPNGYFHTERRRLQLEQVKQGQEALLLDHDADHKYGTVGAAALDTHGNLAAGTSTGGMTNKMFGRVGDSPIIGAGTYANNASCAVSGTGQGEYFIRATVARDICALMEYAGLSLAEAARRVVQDTLTGLGGQGGIIAVDRDGGAVFEFNTEGMYRARVAHDTDAEIAIYRD